MNLSDPSHGQPSQTLAAQPNIVQTCRTSCLILEEVPEFPKMQGKVMWDEALTDGVGALTHAAALTAIKKNLVTVQSESAEANWAES